jgi:hypothetical protein
MSSPKAVPPEERRKFARRPVTWPVSVVGERVVRRARCVDASLGGLSISFDDSGVDPAPGAHLTLIIEPNPGEHVFLDSQVVRSHKRNIGLRVRRVTQPLMPLLFGT